jgi:hypothetical protein
VDEHQRHLEQDLELGGDDLGPAVIERLGAVAALQDEPLAALGRGDLGLSCSIS